MTDMQVPSDSLLGLPISLTPPPVDDAAQVVLSAEEAYASQIAHEKEFVYFLEQLWPVLRACAYKLMKNKHDGEDVVQDALLKTWDSDVVVLCGGDFDNIKAYMLQAVYNCGYDASKKRKGLWAFVDKWSDHIRLWPKAPEAPDDYIDNREIDRIIAAEFRRLPEKQREVFRLVRILEVRYATAAEALHTTTKSVSTYLTAACRQLRTRLTSAGYSA